MSIAELFKGIHGAIEFDELIPLKNKLNNEGFPSEEQFVAAVEYLGIDEDKLFYDPNCPIHPIIYLHEFNYMPIYSFAIEAMKMMQTKEAIKYRNDHFKELKDENDYVTMFQMADKKLLIPLYKQQFDKIFSLQVRYEIFIELHTRSEYGFEMFDTDFLTTVFSLRTKSSARTDRMNELLEKAARKKKFKVYHGHNIGHDPKDEYSWTLSEETALFFANRFSNNGMVSSKYIMFNDVIDYISSRGESEIILFTENLK